jgi:hypothetical protein
VTDVNPLAVRAFGARAADYERGRPGWPGDAVAGLLERFGAGNVVDLAAGTGKLTRVLAERADTVIAIEPVDGMREVLREQLPHVRAMSGTAEAIPLGGLPLVRPAGRRRRDRPGAQARRRARGAVERRDVG